MTLELHYYDEVIIDIREAKQWYRKQQRNLDKRFAEDIKITVKRLQKKPLNYEVKYRNVRIAYCDVFPYAVHFYINDSENKLIIIAIVHQHRDPDYASKR
jgi:plasmid stabilization system protein ParE